jgi:hypothetical protein
MIIQEICPTSVSSAYFEPKDPMTEAAQDRFYCKLTRNPHTGSKGSLMMYEAVLLRNGEEIQTLYWNGSLQETVNLARTIAVKCKADRFRIIEFGGSGAEVHSEEAASLNNRQ